MYFVSNSQDVESTAHDFISIELCCLKDDISAKVKEGHSTKESTAGRTIANDLPRTGCDEAQLPALENVLLAYSAPLAFVFADAGDDRCCLLFVVCWLLVGPI